MLFTYEIIAINFKMLSYCQYWNVFTLWAPLLGIIIYILLWLAYEQVCWFTWDGCYTFSWITTKPFFWLALMPFLVLALLPGVLQIILRKHRYPQLSDILNEAYYLGYFFESDG